MTRSIIIIGCGGLGREALSIVAALRESSDNWSVEGFVDDNPAEDNVTLVKELGSRVLGPVAWLTQRGPTDAVIAIGSNTVRAEISERLSDFPVSWATLVHPSSTKGMRVELGPGAIISAGVRLTTNIRLGRHVQLDQNCTVGHDTVIGDYARLSPQACVTGSVRIEERALIGANATVLPGLRVGKSSIVGAGAVVVSDVPDGVTVKGVPAR